MLWTTAVFEKLISAGKYFGTNENQNNCWYCVCGSQCWNMYKPDLKK